MNEIFYYENLILNSNYIENTYFNQKENYIK